MSSMTENTLQLAAVDPQLQIDIHPAPQWHHLELALFGFSPVA